jgi:hypothetical protein
VSPGLLFVIGASGVGKTAAVDLLARRALPGVRCYQFDAIGVPSPDAMEREFGGAENWQAVATAHWVERLARNPDGADVAVLEGQTRPSFIRPALERARMRHARIVLLDCQPDVRAMRLAGPRGQPELATSRMEAWAAYLRGQADALALPVVDTTRQPLDAVADWLQDQALSLRAEWSKARP